MALDLPLREPAPMQVLPMSIAQGQLVQQRLVHPIQRFGLCPLGNLWCIILWKPLYGRFFELVKPVVGPRGVELVLTRAVIFAPADGPNPVVAGRTPVRLAADWAGELLAHHPPAGASHHSPPGPRGLSRRRRVWVRKLWWLSDLYGCS